MNIKNLLSYLLAFTVGFSFVACDECATEDAGGAEGGAMGGAADCGGAAGGAMGGMMSGTMGATMGAAEAGAGMMMQPTVYNTIVILDSTGDNNINDDGTPGVDIAEVNFDCPDGVDRSGSADGEIGSEICNGDNGMNCVCRDRVAPTCTTGIDRSDFASAEDGDFETYVSLGMEGLVQFKFTGDVNGCEVSIFEVQGRNAEAYQVFACPEGALEAENPEELCVEVSQAAYPAGDAGTQEENTFTVNTMAN